jgi:hypothetical protein
MSTQLLATVFLWASDLLVTADVVDAGATCMTSPPGSKRSAMTLLLK